MNKLTSRYYFKRISKSQSLSELNQNWRHFFAFLKRRQDYAAQTVVEGYKTRDIFKFSKANKIVIETMMGA